MFEAAEVNAVLAVGSSPDGKGPACRNSSIPRGSGWWSGGSHGRCGPDRGFFWWWPSYSKLTLTGQR